MLWRRDQQLVASAVTGNARRLVTAPWRLFESGHCHPTPRAVTLGEHMFGAGLLATLPYLGGANPVLTLNIVVILTLWVSALAMYTLVAFWTRSAAAAFVAGLLFAFHPGRVLDPVHPFVHGNQWTPFALLFAHRLFTRRGWLDAAGLFLAITLQLLESYYQVLALVLLGGTYGLYLVVRYRRLLPALAPKLLACGAGCAAVAAATFGPYLHAGETWGIFSRAGPILNFAFQFRPGDTAYPGSVVLLLAAVALFDRLRGARRAGGYDPRLVYLTGGVVILWASVYALPIPGFDLELPSLTRYLRAVVPGLMAGRALANLRHGVYLVAAFLAGWGVLVLLEHRRAGTRWLVTGLLSAAALAEAFWPPLVRYSFARPEPVAPGLTAYEVRAPAALVALHGETRPGAVLDIPLDRRALPFGTTEYLLLAAYHGQPVAACYNSWETPIVDEIEALARRLPDRRALGLLHALGFRTLVVHEERVLPKARPARRARFALGVREGVGLVPFGRSGEHAVYRILSLLPVTAELAALAAGGPPPLEATVTPPAAPVEFAFRNHRRITYRHPDPIEPRPLLVRWYTGDELVMTSRVRGLLPLVLAPGEEARRSFEVRVPDAAGQYVVTLAPAETPALVIARQTVRVTTPDAGAASTASASTACPPAVQYQAREANVLDRRTARE
jgi:hypothetical protein